VRAKDWNDYFSNAVLSVNLLSGTESVFGGQVIVFKYDFNSFINVFDNRNDDIPTGVTSLSF